MDGTQLASVHQPVMSDQVEAPIAGAVEEIPAAAPAPKKKPAKAPGVKKPKVKADHPPFAEMIAEAITHNKEKQGSSRQAILAYITGHYNVSQAQAQIHVLRALKKGEANGVLKRAKESGKGAGKYKLVAAAKKQPVKAKKAATKKPVAKASQKAKKAVAAKKKAAKKPVAKAQKSTGKKKVAKKPAAKKSAPKKPVGKKSAPKKVAAKKSSKK